MDRPNQPRPIRRRGSTKGIVWKLGQHGWNGFDMKRPGEGSRGGGDFENKAACRGIGFEKVVCGVIGLEPSVGGLKLKKSACRGSILKNWSVGEKFGLWGSPYVE